MVAEFGLWWTHAILLVEHGAPFVVGEELFPVTLLVKLQLFTEHGDKTVVCEFWYQKSQIR